MGIKTKKPWQGLVSAAAGSTVADTCCAPIDMVKVRLQLAQSGVIGERYSGVMDCVRTVLRQEGVGGFFKGLSPALLRSCTYGSARIGLYEPFKQAIAGDAPASSLSIGAKMFAGIGSGAVASFVFNPCDMIKVRMQADRDGKRYRNIFQAFRSIAQQEGVVGMYTGASATVGRAAVCAMVELVTYDEAKSSIMSRSWWPFADSLPTHLAAAMVAGLFSTIASQPIDLVKSRMLNQGRDAQGKPLLYSNPLQCVRATIAKEGIMGLYAGFGPNYARLGPHTALVFIVVEQVRQQSGWADVEVSVKFDPGFVTNANVNVRRASEALTGTSSFNQPKGLLQSQALNCQEPDVAS